LEVGAGTCQMSMYFAIGTNNQIVALDPALESLKLGKKFMELNNIKNVNLINADIFDDVLEENVFDFVWCSGVLHHTKDPYEAFKIIIKTVKKNGYIVITLYNKFGRIRTKIRKFFYKIFGKKLLMLFDPMIRNVKKNSKEQMEVWIRDQYKHPVESLHTLKSYNSTRFTHKEIWLLIHIKEKFSLLILIQINQSQLNWSSISSRKRS
jgi:ubiquinone/menaquinone biosynthesis C-methylase UbiE